MSLKDLLKQYDSQVKQLPKKQENKRAPVQYKAIYDDMLNNSVKYLSAWGGNKKKYNDELSFYERMAYLSDLKLPSHMTREIDDYAQMRVDPDRYMEDYGLSQSEFNKSFKQAGGLVDAYYDDLMRKINTPEFQAAATSSGGAEKWLKEASGLINGITQALGNLNNPAQNAREFSTYADAQKGRISELLAAAGEAYNTLYQNKKLFNQMYGTGEAEKLLGNMQQGKDALAMLTNDINAGVGYLSNRYGDFQTKEGYDKAVAEAKRYDLLKGANLDQVQKMIDITQNVKDTVDKTVGQVGSFGKMARLNTPEAYPEQIAALKKLEGEQVRANDMLSMQKQTMDEAKRIQKAEGYRGLLTLPDFNKYVERGKGVSGGAFEADKENAVGRIFSAAVGGPFNDPMDKLLPDTAQATEEEKQIYYYLRGKDQEHGTNTAEEFFEWLKDDLKGREGAMIADSVKGKKALEILFGIPAGAAQFNTGINQLLSSDAVPTSSTTRAGEILRNELAGDGAKIPDFLGGSSMGQIGYDALQTGTAMAPAIAASVLTSGAGAPAFAPAVAGGVTFAYTKGNAYKRALDEGYTKDQAEGYSVLVGASEAGLQYFLSGIGALGGTATKGVAAKVISNIDSALLRVAAQIPIRALGEGIEEYLQEVLEPVFRNIAFGEKNAIDPLNPEALYAGFLGAIMGGVIDLPGSVGKAANAKGYGTAVASAGRVEDLIGKALDLDAQSKAHHMASQMESGQMNKSDINIGELTFAYTAETGDSSFINLRKGVDDTGFENTLRQTADEMTRPQEAVSELRTAAKTGEYTTFPGTAAQTGVATADTASKAAAIPVETGGKGHAATFNDNSGAPLTVTGISAVRDGQVYVRKQDGNEVALDAITFDDPQIDRLYQQAAMFDTNTAKVFISSYDGSMSVNEYALGFTSIYGEARKGTAKAAAFANSLYGRRLTPLMQEAAYLAGQNSLKAPTVTAQPQTVKADTVAESVQQPEKQDSKTEPAKEPEKTDSNPEKKGNVVRRYTGQTTKAQEQQIESTGRMLAAVGKGRTVVFEDSITEYKGHALKSGVNAYFDAETNEYHIALDSVGQAYMYIAVHETVHDIASNNTDGYARLREVVLDTLRDAGQDIDALLKIQQALHPDQNTEYWTEEVVANTVPVILTDAQTMRDLAERVAGENEDTRNAFLKLLDKIKGLLQKAYNALKGEKSWAQMKVIEGDMMAIANIREAYMDALDGIAEKESGDGTRFSMKDSIESTNDLIAVHNLYDSKLREALKLGGFPMPSIAVTKPELGHEHFGDISLIFKRDTIDPAVSSDNKVYSGDAWTPTFPSVEYKVNDKVASGISKKINEIMGGYSEANKYGYMGLDADNMTDYARRHDGDVKAAYKDKLGLKEAYLKQNGVNILPVMVEKRVSDWYDNDMLRMVLDELGADEINRLVNESSSEISEKADELKEIANKYFLEKHGAANFFKKELGFSRAYDMIHGAKKLYDDPAPMRIDEGEMRKKIESELDEKGYDEWLSGLFDGIIEKKGIPNGSSIYTSSGNRRSFEATHWEITLDNIVRAMKKEDPTGSGAFFGATAITGVATESFKSVAAMKKDSGRLVEMDDDAYQEAKSKILDRLADISRRIVKDTGSDRNNFSAVMDAGDAIVDVLKKARSPIAIYNAFKEWGQWYDVTMDIANEIYQLYADTRNMPSRLFEAKPRRVVGFNEVAAAILPEGEYADIRQGIEQRGIPVYTYDKNVEGDRLRVLNGAEIKPLRFSLKDTSDFSVNKLEKQNAKLTAAVDMLKEQFKLTQGHKVSDRALQSLAGKTLRDYKSSYDKQTLVENLRTMFDYLANAEEPAWNEVSQMGVNMARAIIEQSSELDTETHEYYADARKTLRETRIKLNDAQRAEAAYAFGTYREYRQSVFGSVNLTNDGIDLDKVWNELSEKYPAVFDPDISDVDMPAALVGAVEAMKPQYINPYGYNMNEAAYDLFLQIYDAYFGIPEVKTFADKQAAKLALLKAKYGNMIADIRQDAKQRYSERIKEVRAEEREKREAIRVKYNEAKAKNDKANMDKLREQYRALTDKMNEKLMKQRAQFERKETVSREKQAERELRQKIRAIADDFKQRITKPSERRYVPKELMRDVLEVAQMLNFESGREGKYGGVSRADQMLSLLRDQYTKLAQDQDYAYSSAYDQSISNDIAALAETLGDTPIRKMKLYQLQGAYEILRRIQFTLREAVKLIDMHTRYDIYGMGEQVITEIRKSKGSKNTGLSAFANKFNSASLAAIRFVRRISGYMPDSQFEALVREINAGQMKQSDIQMKGLKIFDKFVKDKEALKEFAKFQGADAEWIDIGIKDYDGKPVKVSRAMRVALYLHSLNEDNAWHIANGGVTIPEEKAYRKGDFEAAYDNGTRITLSEDFLSHLKNDLTAYEKRFAQVAYLFFNEFTKSHINETSMKLKGYKLAGVEHYFPINVNKNFLRVDFEALVHDGTIEGMGMLKSRVKGSNPIYLEEVTSAIMRQLGNVSKYAGLAIPVRNFNKVFNVTSVGYSDSVKNAVAQKWGKPAKEYIENLMTDIQSGRREAPSWFDRVKGRFAQATLAANISVTLKQAASYPTAASVVGWGPLVKAFGAGKVDVNLVAKYTPLLWLRSQGMVDTELAEATKRSDWSGKVPWLMGWIQAVDVATVSRLWYAAEYYVRDNFKDLKQGTDAYYQKTAEVFNEIVEDTQPNYSVMQRPDVLRNPNKLVRSLTMFMTQRLQNYGIMYDAIAEHSANVQRVKSEPTAANKELAKQSGAKLRRAVTSQTVAAVTIAAMTLLAKTLTHAMNGYRDDDDELTKASVWGKFVDDIFATMAGSVLGGSELYTAVSNVVRGKNYDVLQVPVVSMINEIAATTNKIITLATAEDVKGDNLLKAVEELAYTVATMFGVPAKNVKNILSGIVRHIEDAAAGRFGSFEAGFERGVTSSYESLYQAVLDGDKDKIKYIRDKLMGDKDTPKSAKDIDMALAKLLMENDPRIAQAYKARAASDIGKLKQISNKVKADGFSHDVVVYAINKYESSLDGKEDKDLTETLSAPLYDYKDLFAAIRAGVSDAAIKEIKQEIIKHSKANDPEESVRKEVIENIKPDYVDAVNRGDTKTAEALAEKMLMFGVDEEKFGDWIMADKNKNLKAALGEGDVRTANEFIAEQVKLGKSDGDIKKYITAFVKPLVIEAYETDGWAGVNRYINLLASLNLKNTSNTKYNGYPYYYDEFVREWVYDYLEKQ